MDLIEMRPAHKSRYGKAEIDQVYFTCSEFNAPLPQQTAGVLTLDNYPQFVHPVARLAATAPLVANRNRTAVCTKAFYGKGINVHTIEQFVLHYIETWRFDYIVLYELGTTIGVLLLDVIQSSALLSAYLAQGRLIVMDLRPELQREYGAAAGDTVLLSSKNGQLVVSSDCINRAKTTLTDVEWVLLIDWDEILTIGPYRKSVPESFASFAKEKSTFLRHRHRKRWEVDVLDFSRHRAPDTSICTREEDCGGGAGARLPWDQDSWAYHSLKFEVDQFLNASRRTETMNKYAVRIASLAEPAAWTYGVHDLGGCAFPQPGGLRYAVALHDVYLRHYKCLNAPPVPSSSSSQCGGSTLASDTKHAVDWPLEFGERW